MALRYLLDENARGGLWTAIIRHNGLSSEPIDVERVGDPVDLPLGSQDPDILRWVEREGRVLVTFDHKSMPPFLWDHLHAGGHCPGMFLIRPRSRIPELVAWLAMAAQS